MFRISETYFIKEFETCSFSTNKPILLKRFTFAIDTIDNKGGLMSPYTCFEGVLQSEIKILEIPIQNDSGKAVTIYSGRVNIFNDLYTYKLTSNAILIRPGFTYEVQMTQSPPKNCCTAYLLKSEVNLESDLTITFHPDPTIVDLSRDLIVGMTIIPL